MGAKSGNDSRFFDSSRRTTSLCVIHEDGLDECNSAVASDGEHLGQKEKTDTIDQLFNQFSFRTCSAFVNCKTKGNSSSIPDVPLEACAGPRAVFAEAVSMINGD
jgi:hypothetical protein